MTPTLQIALSTIASLALSASSVLAQPATDTRTFSATLTGAAEVPGPGDTDGSGTATIRVNRSTQEICYDLTVSNIAPATAAHIHVGGAGVAGPVAVPLEAPSDGTSSGCVKSGRWAAQISVKPQDFYVNVHNADFPAGAVRGQLVPAS